MARIDQVFDAKPGTPAGNELERLLILVEQYEDRIYPIDPSQP